MRFEVIVKFEKQRDFKDYRHFLVLCKNVKIPAKNDRFQITIHTTIHTIVL